MLPPITEQEKAVYTLRLQLEKGTEELLVEAYESGQAISISGLLSTLRKTKL